MCLPIIRTENGRLFLPGRFLEPYEGGTRNFLNFRRGYAASQIFYLILALAHTDFAALFHTMHGRRRFDFLNFRSPPAAFDDPVHFLITVLPNQGPALVNQ